MNAPFHASPATPQKHRFTGEDILRMQEAGLLLEGGKFELIDGEIIDMPSEGDPHVELKIALTRFLIRAVPDSVSVAPDATLKLADRNWPEPDFYLFPAAIRVGKLRGPDLLLVIELSNTSLKYDLGRKAALYRRHGVREYWVIDLEGRLAHVHRLAEAWPAAPVPLTETLEASLIPGLRVRIADIWQG